MSVGTRLRRPCEDAHHARHVLRIPRSRLRGRRRPLRCWGRCAMKALSDWSRMRTFELGLSLIPGIRRLHVPAVAPAQAPREPRRSGIGTTRLMTHLGLRKAADLSGSATRCWGRFLYLLRTSPGMTSSGADEPESRGTRSRFTRPRFDRFALRTRESWVSCLVDHALDLVRHDRDLAAILDHDPDPDVAAFAMFVGGGRARSLAAPSAETRDGRLRTSPSSRSVACVCGSRYWRHSRNFGVGFLLRSGSSSGACRQRGDGGAAGAAVGAGGGA